MELKKRDIQVELRTVIDDQGEKELSIIRQAGKYYRKGQLEVVTYNEEIEAGEVSNFMTIQDGKVTIKRSGAVSMNQRFMTGKVTDSVYRHPYGVFHFEIYTKNIVHQVMEEGKLGSVVVDYDMTINGQQTRNHHITLTYGGKI